MQAILLAGGRGLRLRPLSNNLPKPLLPVGGMAVAEILVRQLQKSGVDEVVMCLGYLSQLIMDHFQDGKKFGLKIRYCCESAPRGTAGPIMNVSGLEDNFLVVNGDELTTLDFAALLNHHVAIRAAMTIAVQHRQASHNCGVLEILNGRVLSYREKPSYNLWVSMGIYAMNHSAVNLIRKDTPFDIPDLVEILLSREAKIASYVSNDLWIDIGTQQDLQKAQKIDLARLLEPMTVKEGIE